jgi:shikimate dehydrogenase
MKFGLIGKSLSHSFSKDYILKNYCQKIPNLQYDLIEIPSELQLEHFINTNDLDGFNVTIPYKEKIMSFLSQFTEEAKQAGAVNCVKRTRNGWLGHNTDIEGFLKSIKPYFSPHWKKALILGDGGAAKAVLFGLKKLGLSAAFVSRKNNFYFHTTPVFLYSQIIPEILQYVDVIINTTPAGMFPHVSELPPFPTHLISERHFVMDLIYNPQQTLFLKKSAEQGAQTLNGLNMLYFQADASVDFWLK